MTVLARCCLALTLVVPTTALRADEVDDYVRREMDGRRIPGAAIAVVKDGALVKIKSYGLASVELDIPASTDTVFVLASLTKTFTSVATLLLVERGEFSLDDSVLVSKPYIVRRRESRYLVGSDRHDRDSRTDYR